jgi:hypothetical protein
MFSYHTDTTPLANLTIHAPQLLTPSGAPWLAGEEYAHDKGVSAELMEREKDRDGDLGQSEVERGRQRARNWPK